jgi:predicted transposase YbfD/YdcC
LRPGLAVSRSVQRETSSMIEGLATCFTGLEDPRETSRCDPLLIEILVIAVCAVIACAESWEDIELSGRSKQAWLQTFLTLPNGIPSHDTFRRVFLLIDPDAFERCFTRWVQSRADGGSREVVAVDGKAVRRSASRRHDHGPLHLVSAWASRRGLALGQRAVEGKSNEIRAIPELLDTLHLDDCIVTLDAMGCQRGIAERIRAKGADYLLVLKANHGNAYRAVRAHFERTCLGPGAGGRAVFDAFDQAHGRLVRRRVFVDVAATALAPLRDWPDLSRVLARRPVYAAGARKLRGTMTTCSRSSPTRLMREP